MDGWTLAALVLLAGVGHELVLWQPSAMGTGYQDSVEGFLYDPGGGGTLLISLAVVAWLVWRRRDDLAAAAACPRGRAWALFPLVLSGVVRIWAEYTDAVDLQLPALALFLLGGAGLIGGRGAMARVWLPCAVLVVSMPIPVAILNWLIYPMQVLAARGAAAILELGGVSHLLMGEQIHTSRHAFYVVEGCAGLRSLQTLLLATIVYCEVLYRSRAQVVGLLLCVVPVGLVANQLRVLSIILDPASDLSGDHTAQGLVMTSVGVIAIAVIDALAQRLSGGRLAADASSRAVETGLAGKAEGRTEDAVAGTAVRRWPWALLLFCAAAMIFVPARVARWTPPERETPRLADAIPVRFDDWQAHRTLQVDREFMGSVRYSDWLARRYRSKATSEGDGTQGGAASEFELIVLADHHEQRHQGVISAKTAIAHPGQVVEERDRVTIGAGEREGTRLVLRGPEERELVLHWRLNARGRLDEFARSALALDQGPWHRPRPTLAVRLSVRLSRDPGVARAQEALLEEMAGWVDERLFEEGLSDRH